MSKTADVFKAAEKHFKVDLSKPAKDFFSMNTRAKEMAILYAMEELKSNYKDIMRCIDIDRTTISLLHSFGKSTLQNLNYLKNYKTVKNTL